jgi:hypothetical protein
MNKIASKDTMPSFKEFHRDVMNLSPSQNSIETLYSKIPKVLKSLSNFDPTGGSGFVISILEGRKQDREQMAVLKAIYLLFMKVLEIEKLLLPYSENKEKADYLVERYLDTSRRVDNNKIESLRNVICNGFIGVSSFSDTDIFLDAIEKLHLIQVEIVVICYQEFLSNSANKIRISFIKESLSIDLDESRIMYFTSDLIGRGILADWGVGKYDYEGPVNFSMTSFGKDLYLSLIEPQKHNCEPTDK